MAGKSKTDVSARAGMRNTGKHCSLCGNKVEVVMSVIPPAVKTVVSPQE